MLLRLHLILLTFLSVCQPRGESAFRDNTTETVITFGSCHDQRLGPFDWRTVLENDPDLWIWNGDIIYYDTREMDKKKHAYLEVSQNPSYLLFKKKVPVVGTWDDHDYGANGAGREYREKNASQDLLLDFLDVPANSKRRKQKGVYSSHTIAAGEHVVKVILLDLRYFREEPGSRADLLGRAQWRWLERELSSGASINLIVSSSMFVPVDQRSEKWADYPQEKEKMLELIDQTNAQGVIFLAGDRHYGDLSRLTETPFEYPLYELLSSGMTHHREEEKVEENRYRVDEFYVERNFGIVKIRWDEDPLITMEIRDLDNHVQVDHQIRLSEVSSKP